MGRFMERIINKMGGVQIFCLIKDIDEYIKRFNKLKKERSELYENVTDVANLYNFLYWGNRPKYTAQKSPSYLESLIKTDGMISHNNCIKYYIGLPTTLNNFIDYIVHRLENRKSPIDYSLANFCGSLKYSDYLFIGDKANPNKRFLWPFYEYNHSSLYLTKILNELNFPEERLFFVNINQEDGVQVIHDWVYYKIEKKEDYKVILLGNNAEKTFIKSFNTNLIPKIYKTCHPSAAMRFTKYSEQFKINLFTAFFKEE
jgi:hypothetical protein